MDSKKWELFAAAAELGSFTKAAEHYGYTQSGVTHVILGLEKETGFPLLTRNHNGVALTSQGRELLPVVKEFLRTADRLESRIGEVASHQTATIRIAAYASIAMHWMPEILYRFRRSCPEVPVELRMVDHALEPFELLSQGKCDVIFAGRQEHMSCAWIPLYDEPMFAILPMNYPLNGRSSFPLEEFAGLDFLMPYGRFDLEVNAALRRVGVTVKTTAAKVDDETVIRMVGKGLGVSMMAELMLRGRTDDVQCVPVTPKTIRELGLGLNKDNQNEPIRKLTACATAYIRELHKQQQET